MRVITSIALIGMLSACATSPANINSAYVSPAAYSSMTCRDIDTEIYAVDTKAQQLYNRLSGRANGDAWKMGIGLVVAWPALLFLSGGDGPDAAEYAQLKGQKDALIAARRSCADRSMAGAQVGDIPGTLHYGRVTLVPAETVSGMCIVAPANYVGTGAMNSPAITNAMPRCSSLPPVR